MKKTIAVAVAVIVSGFAFIALQDTAYTGGTMPAPDAESVWDYITQKDYTQWKFFPGYEGMYPGQSPHGAHLKLYANDIAYDAAKNNRPMPEGAILVKENYGKDKSSLMAVTPMYKVSGYNPGASDWFWAKYGPDGKAMAAGKVDSCISCHEAMGGGDYVVTEPK
ncbi:MAG: cytochrome P460 family protein [Desulfobacterales bacterium]|nr:cytochrome P460 family protein [Desulfobacterales bacterium]MBS3754287.1 cytochrome P460 family protein [Desulfobacterales bacterium]